MARWTFSVLLHAKNPLTGSSTPAETTQDSRVDDYRILSLVSGKTLHNIQPRQQHRGGGRIVLTACNQRTPLLTYMNAYLLYIKGAEPGPSHWWQTRISDHRRICSGIKHTRTNQRGIDAVRKKNYQDEKDWNCLKAGRRSLTMGGLSCKSDPLGSDVS